MKKLIYSTFLGLFLMLASCQSITNSLTVVSKCCKMLSAANKNKADQSDKESDHSKNAALLPINSWDGKMLIW